MDLQLTDNTCLKEALAHLAQNVMDDVARCTQSIHMDHALWNCDGSPNTYPGGSWIGHMLPCLIFIIWSSHWMLGIFRVYLERLPGEPYVSLPYHRLLWLSPEWPFEPICKFALPPFAIMAELLWAHSGGWRTLVCSPEDPRAEHFHGGHLGNWSHACMYIGFIVSGIVDYVGHHIELPKGTQKVFLSMAFLLEALLMGLHEKATPMDIALHTFLTYSMLASAACVLMEHVYPESFLFSCGRVAAVALQSLWFHAVARISFEGVPAWDTISNKDLAPVMFVPVYFVMHILGIILVMTTVFLLMSWSYGPLAGSAHDEGSAAERKGLMTVEEGQE